MPIGLFWTSKFLLLKLYCSLNFLELEMLSYKGPGSCLNFIDRHFLDMYSDVFFC